MPLRTSVASFLVLGGQDPQMYRQKKKSNLYARASEHFRNIYFQVSNLHLHVQSMQFPFITCGMALYRQYNDKILNFEYASELRKIFAFSHYKTDISFYILLVPLTLCLRNIYIFRSQITPAAVSFYYLWYGGMALYKL